MLAMPELSLSDQLTSRSSSVSSNSSTVSSIGNLSPMPLGSLPYSPSTESPAMQFSIPPSVHPAMPTVLRRDEHGVDWVQFSYSKDRVKTSYTIRCDIDSIQASESAGSSVLTPDFKLQNCIYPRACVPPDQYRGHRQKYETECNSIGWCLAYLNPQLQGQRGLLQRAVDTWRNTNANHSLRSRRVRRMGRLQDKMKTAAAAAAREPLMNQPPYHPHHAPGSGGYMLSNVPETASAAFAPAYPSQLTSQAWPDNNYS